MFRASIARRTSDGTIAAAALEIIAPTSHSLLLREVSLTLVAVTASVFGLGRPAAKGITPTTPVQFMMEAGSDKACRATTAIAWGTGPTVPAQFFRRASLPAAIGALATWTFGNGLIIPANFTLVLWNITANSLVDVNVIAEESTHGSA